MDDIDFSYEGFVSIVPDRGILKKILKRGHSPFPPSPTDFAVIHYVGWYHFGEKHGELFDSSRARNKPISIPIGFGHPIRAFDVVAQSMKLGEICEIIVFPDYAYYDSQTRRYEIELVDFYGKVHPGNSVIHIFKGSYNCCGPNSPILISCIKEGNRNVSPLPGEKVTVHLEAYCNDELFDCRDESFIMGDFDGSGLPEGLCKKLFSCNDGGEYRFKVTKPMLVTPMECEKRGIPEDAVLWYNVIIKTCELRERPNRSVSSKENMAALLSMKKRANDFFKAGKYKLADYMYSCIECLGFHNCDREDYQHIRSTTYQNRALCLLKLNLPNECIRACDWALKKDPCDEKCLFRRGLAYIMKNDYNEAEKCFKKVLEVNAENVEAETKLKLCKELLSKESTREKGIFTCAIKQLGDDAFSADAD